MNDKSIKQNDTQIELKKYICSECESKNISTTWEDYKFPYGVGAEAVELSCKVPVRKCSDCGFSFIDQESENLCHEAVCKHLGVMTPAQIKSLRQLYNFTQTLFSEITKLGEATLSRWERGIIVQNGAYDNYLYLLGFSENLYRIIDRNKPVVPETTKENVSATFKEIKVTEELLQRKRKFKLAPLLVAGE
jgi:putative zinc finger/helix-turn-helix YgiT family protein